MAKELSRCGPALAVTDSGFTGQARALARANGVALWERDRLGAPRPPPRCARPRGMAPSASADRLAGTAGGGGAAALVARPPGSSQRHQRGLGATPAGLTCPGQLVDYLINERPLSQGGSLRNSSGLGRVSTLNREPGPAGQARRPPEAPQDMDCYYNEGAN